MLPAEESHCLGGNRFSTDVPPTPSPLLLTTNIHEVIRVIDIHCWTMAMAEDVQISYKYVRQFIRTYTLLRPHCVHETSMTVSTRDEWCRGFYKNAVVPAFLVVMMIARCNDSRSVSQFTIYLIYY